MAVACRQLRPALGSLASAGQWREDPKLPGRPVCMAVGLEATAAGTIAMP